METLIKAIGTLVLSLLVMSIVVILTGYITMLLVNFIFTQAIILALFGSVQLTFWKAYCLNWLFGCLVRTGGSKE